MKRLINKYITFIKYGISAGISFILDLALFTLIVNLLKLSISSYAIIIATIFARIISSYVNYHLNRNKVFKNNKDNSKIDKDTFTKYIALVIIQVCVSSLTVFSLYNLTHLNETIIKIPVEILLFLVNYFVQKFFIFNDKRINIPNGIYKYLNIILSIITTFTFFVVLNKKTIITITRKNTNVFTTLVFGILIYLFYKKYLKDTVKRNTFKVLSIIFSLLLVFGYSFDLTDSAVLVYSNVYFIIISLFKFIGFYTFINLSLNLLYNYIVNKKIIDLKENKIVKLFNKHPFIFSIIVMLICFILYIIAYYPAIMGFDPANQIKEVLGIHTRYMDSVALIDKSVTITNFNPIIHTLLLGNLFKLGINIGNVNLGLFIYTIIQTIVMVSILGYSIVFLKKEKVPNKICFIVLAIYSLVPIFPFYALSTNKDTFFSLLMLLYIIKLYQLIKYNYKLKEAITLIIISILLFLFRNNGIITIILSLPVAFIILKDKRKMIGITILAILIGYFGYNKVLLPKCKITQTSVREVLSIPFQQTAALINNDEKIIESKDKKVIASILDYDSIKENYNPELADKVKNTFNKNYKQEQLNEYFSVWLKYLVKRPLIYIDATVNNMYGYFYPNTSKWNLYYEYNTKLKEAGYDYHYNKLSNLRDALYYYGNGFQYIPLIGMMINIGFVVWTYLVLIGFLIISKSKKHILILIPALSLILVCIASPANAYFRYALPYIMALPVTLAVIYNNVLMKKR